MTDGRSRARLSVNVNKVATLRNSRGGNVPSVVDATRVSVAAGSPGITVHPRADARHITFDDVRQISEELRSRGAPVEGPVEGNVELNIEGDPRPDLLALADEIRPDQFTLVPVRPGEVTSQAGWDPQSDVGQMREFTGALSSAGIRVSIFVDPDPAAVEWAATVGGDRIELYTEPFARAFHEGRGRESFELYSRMATRAHELGLGVNAGHDLDLANLTLFRDLPHLDEASIGHALISHALYVGLDRAVRDYIAALGG
jgi:pyridoxine 5-phosphate synthase